MSVSVAVQNVSCHLAEGPHWVQHSQSLLYVDLYMGDVHRWNSVTGQDEQRHFDGAVGFVIPRSAGGYLIAQDKTLRAIDWDTSQVVKTYGEVEPGTSYRLNDGKCDASGRLWTGTFIGQESAEDQKSGGALYSLEQDGSIRKHIGNISASNGLAWTADNRTMFYVDSSPRKVYAFDFDIESGSVGNQRVFLDRSVPPGTPDTNGGPDGMCMDSEGKLWIACYGPGKVIRVDSETGQLVQTVSLPARYITSCCFGGSENNILYVTSAKKRLSAEERIAEPTAGSIFKVTGLGVKGVPVADFGG